MNYNASMKQYINDEISARTSSLNPHKIIEEVLIDLKKNMETWMLLDIVKLHQIGKMILDHISIGI